MHTGKKRGIPYCTSHESVFICMNKLNVPLSLSVSLMPIHVTPGWHTRSESDSGVEYWFDTICG